MNKLTFNKKQEKYCMYCRFGQYLEYSDEVFCSKKGFVNKFGKCLKYKYDPLKRVPITNDIKSDFKKEDFEIWLN